MKNAIVVGKAGRLVIPKALRTGLGLREGSRLSVRVAGGVLQMEPLPDEVRIEQEDGFPVIRGAPPRLRARVIEAIKADRAERDQRLAGKPECP